MALADPRSDLSGSIEIRPYRADDRAEIQALWQGIFPDGADWNQTDPVIDRKQSVQPDLFYVACADKHVIGTILAGFDGVRGWVHRLAVHQDYRRRGIAGQLMHRAEAGLKAIGCPKLNLQVRASNAQVVQFYQSLGYAIEERVSLGKALV
ncbi:MAG: GNAT family acetyltransferase [Pseudomonadota bacterium]